MYRKSHKNQLWSLPDFVLNRIKTSLWLWISPLITVVISLILYLILNFSPEAKAILSEFALKPPDFISSWYIHLSLVATTVLGFLFYFLIDYEQHYRPLESENPKVQYNPLHHARVVVVPRLRYNWKQAFFQIGYGIASMVFVSFIITSYVSPTYAYAPDEFVFTVATTYSEYSDPPGDYITVQTNSGEGDSYPGQYQYNYNVDWGDGTITTNNTETVSHLYDSAGTYEIKITGQFPQLAFGYGAYGDQNITIEQWGNNPWEELSNAFIFTGSVDINATDSPNLSQVSDLSGMFRETSMNSDISQWDMSNITSIKGMFAYNEAFNQDISGWDTGNVTDMSELFLRATAFNQDISGWDTGNVTDMSWMFTYAASFSQSINGWDTSSVTNMGNMFTGSTFNQPLNNWDVSNVTDMSAMFALTPFNQSVNSWDTSSVTSMRGMFGFNTVFNQPLNNWDVSNVTDMSAMFSKSTSFNQSLGSWDVSSVEEIADMFAMGAGLSSYNYDSTLLGWSSLDLVDGLTFNAGSSTYCHGGAYKTAIINHDSWTINDAGMSCPAGSTAPFVTTKSASNLTGESADISGEVIDDGGESITVAGFEYGETSSMNQDTGSLTTSIGDYTTSLTSLECGTKYYYRAYATNSKGTSYGINKTFTTEGCPFVTTWKTDSPGDSIQIPAAMGSGFTYNYTVDWGDGTVESNLTTDGVHAYASPGVHTVKIIGDLPYFAVTNPNKFLSVEQWGDIQWQSMASSFSGAVNLEINATDAPDLSQVTDMSYMFNDVTGFNSDISNWDTSHVTIMEGLLYSADSSNPNIGGWDTSAVVNMNNMFRDTDSFNADISNWDTSNVTDMNSMFRGATAFNQPLNSWNTSSVTSMAGMFYDATSFNQNIDSWDTSQVQYMSHIFSVATAFNQPLNSWNTSSVTSMAGMFYDATAFNQPLNNWDTSSVTSMAGMFYGATAFNQPLDNWDVSNVVSMESMFMAATAFNQPLNSWNTSSVTSMFAMFAGATSFNQSLAAWNVSNVTDMTYFMLHDPLVYPGGTLNPSGLSTANYDVTLVSWSAQNLQPGATFDAGLSTYCNSEAQRQSIIDSFSWTINDAGEDCASPDFTNAFITTWKTDNPGESNDNQITIPTDPGEAYNYSVDWGDGNVTTNETSDATHTYSNPGTYTVKIIGDFPRIRFYNGYYDGPDPLDNSRDRKKILTIEQWGDIEWSSMEGAFTGAINLQSNAPDAPDLSNVTNMAGMFANATAFNSNIEHWDVGNVENMASVFRDATSFNKPLNNWDTSNVTDMSGMFLGATSFNQSLGNWHTDNVVNMYGMFADATSFNQPLNSWDTGSVVNMGYLFAGATSFNRPLSNWDTSKVVMMGNMFTNAVTFNQNINSWDVGNVTYMHAMFANAASFNQSLNHWDTSNVELMMLMFFGASSFDQSLASWDMSNVFGDNGQPTGLMMMFNSSPGYDSGTAYYASGLSTPNYDATLTSWSDQGLQSGLTFDAGTSTYCKAEADRQKIINTFTWTINDSGKDCAQTAKHAYTLNPDKLSSTQARLKGSVAGAGASNFVAGGFQYGKTTSYGKTVSGLNIKSKKFSKTVALECDTQYHYRAFAVDNEGNKTYGANTTFTLSCPDPEDPEPPEPPLPPSDAAPSINIISPKPGEGFATGSDVVLQAKASSKQSKIKEVRFYIDGELVGTVSDAPYEHTMKDMAEGAYSLVAVVEDSDGQETATEPQNFFINKAGISPLELLDPDTARAQLDKLEQQKYVLTGVSASVSRNIPWILLQLLVIAYLIQAYRQSRQNALLKKNLGLTRQTREGIESFLSIVSHYLGTASTIISSSIEMIVKKPGGATVAAVATLSGISKSLKDYINQAIKQLGTQVSSIKDTLETGGKIQRHSIFHWVILPSIVALVLMLISLFGMNRLGLWDSKLDNIIFSLIFTAGSIFLTFVSFQVWQNQRQLKVDLLATSKTAEAALQTRRDFIANNQLSLQRQVSDLESVQQLVSEPSFNKLFGNGLKQLTQVSNGMSKVYQLTSSLMAGTAKVHIPIIEALEPLKAQAADKDVALEVNIPAKIESQLLPAELEHVVQTLVDNAIRFTPAGGKVSITANNHGKWFVLRVSDTGTGIAADKLPTLMQPFARGTASETYNYEGLGLNLYITRLVAEKYKGQIDIDSLEGKGAVIEFRAKNIS